MARCILRISLQNAIFPTNGAPPLSSVARCRTIARHAFDPSVGMRTDEEATAMHTTQQAQQYDATGSRSPQWWPSRYGPDDELGAGNELTPERTLEALALPAEGRLVQLAQVLE